MAKKAKAKAKKTASKKPAKEKKANGVEASAIAQEFGIRGGGEREAVLLAISKPIGRKNNAGDLAKLTTKKTTTAVAGIMARVERKIKKLKLPYVLTRGEARGEEQTYQLSKK